MPDIFFSYNREPQTSLSLRALHYRRAFKGLAGQEVFLDHMPAVWAEAPL